MQRAKITICGLLFALASASGCATTESKESDNRDEVLARWSRCVDQRVQDFSGSPANAMDYVFSRCDGHKRDVLASSPRHLEQRLDRILTDKTRAKTMTFLVETTYNDLVGPEAAIGIETGRSEL